MELCRARSFTLNGTRDARSLYHQAQRLDFLAYELNRLFKYPKLFPTASTQARFMALSFDLDSEYNFLESCKTLVIQQALGSLDTESKGIIGRSLLGEEVYGWERFLLPRLAETGICIKPKDKSTSFQLLPAVGMRICADFVREESFISDHKFDTSQSHHEPIALSLLTISDSEECSKERTRPHGMTTLRDKSILSKPFEDRNESQICANTVNQQKLGDFVLNPSPFKKKHTLRTDKGILRATAIEIFSQIMYRLELLGPRRLTSPTALNAPNSFALVGIWSCNRFVHQCVRPCCLGWDSVPDLHVPASIQVGYR